MKTLTMIVATANVRTLHRRKSTKDADHVGDVQRARHVRGDEVCTLRRMGSGDGVSHTVPIAILSFGSDWSQPHGKGPTCSRG